MDNLAMINPWERWKIQNFELDSKFCHVSLPTAENNLETQFLFRENVEMCKLWWLKLMSN